MDVLKYYANSLEVHQQPYLSDVQEYIKSQGAQTREGFRPDESDDVAVRTYLLDCMLQGAKEADIVRITESLEHFYDWLGRRNLITKNPFDRFNLKQSLPNSDQIQHKHDVFLGSPQEREIARLRALNRLGELTNQISSVQSMLDATLETLLEVMDLDTAWISLKADSGFLADTPRPLPEHGFILTSACNLPPGLEQDGRHFLTRPPACHCQKLLSTGRTKRAVNVVECTRLQDAAQSGSHNNGLAFHASVPIMINERAVGLMNFATKDWLLFSASDLQFLTAGARMISSALERAHLYDQNASQRSRMENELKIARQIQVSLLPDPDSLPNIPGMELTAFWQPSLEMSGDYYNVFKLPNGLWGFAIADVCGKGAPAALYMAITHSLIRERVREVRSPANLLAHVNLMLYQQNTDSTFVTAAYAILDPAKFHLTYAVAGHPKPILRRASGQVEELPGSGMALGVMPDACYTDQKIKLNIKDSILFYTDGVTDIFSPDGQAYGLPRLLDMLAKTPGSTKKLVKHLVQDVSAWNASEHSGDDVTLFALGRKN